jgi:hypothetical protein
MGKLREIAGNPPPVKGKLRLFSGNRANFPEIPNSDCLPGHGIV